MTRIDAKAGAGTIGAALNGLLWFLLGRLVLDTWTAEEITTAAGFSGVLIVAALAYMIRNEASPLRGDGDNFAQMPEEGA